MSDPDADYARIGSCAIVAAVVLLLLVVFIIYLIVR